MITVAYSETLMLMRLPSLSLGMHHRVLRRISSGHLICHQKPMSILHPPASRRLLSPRALPLGARAIEWLIGLSKVTHSESRAFDRSLSSLRRVLLMKCFLFIVWTALLVWDWAKDVALAWSSDRKHLLLYATFWCVRPLRRLIMSLNSLFVCIK